jgi:hypothetical protein
MPRFNSSAVKFGRLPKRIDRGGPGGTERTLKFTKYSKALPPPPMSADWIKACSSFDMLGNDDYGDCVFASKGHIIQVCTANEDVEVKLSEQTIIKAYLTFTGGRDQGANILNALKWWRANAAKLGGHALWAYVSIEPTDQEAIKQAIALFGAVKIGVNLAAAWQGADVWDVGRGRNYEPGSWGSHDVPGCSYNADGITVITWADTIKMTWAAVPVYCDEMYALILPDWLRKDAISPSGLDLPTLHKDLFAIGQAESLEG